MASAINHSLSKCSKDSSRKALQINPCKPLGLPFLLPSRLARALKSVAFLLTASWQRISL
jgi:hypothetical protein